MPNFKRAGSYYTAVLVTYPDKSQEYTRQVKVTVKRQKDKSKYQPKVKGKTVAYGAKLTAKSLIKNAKALPKKGTSSRKRSTPSGLGLTCLLSK